MAEKANYPQMPPQGPPPPGMTQIPPPYTPVDPPPAYTYGPGQGMQYPVMGCYPAMPSGGYQGPPTVVLGGPTTSGGPDEDVELLLNTNSTNTNEEEDNSERNNEGNFAHVEVPVVTVVKVGQWGPFPMQVNCPQCNARVMTETSLSPGLLTWLLSGALVFVGCWLGCCLIPCCIPECQDIDHRCPNCKAHLGTFRRI